MDNQDAATTAPPLADQQAAATPKRIQRQRTKGWRMPDGAVYVGRPSKWGNPCRWQDYPRWPSPYLADGSLDDDPHRIPDPQRRRYAVVDFEAALLFDGCGGLPGYPSVEEIRAELAGRDLACWCPPDQACHADVLLRVANAAPGIGPAGA